MENLTGIPGYTWRTFRDAAMGGSQFLIRIGIRCAWRTYELVRVVSIEGRPMSRGSKRTKADVDRDAIRIAELVLAGKTAKEAGAELGIPESTARRLAKRGLALLPTPQVNTVVDVPKSGTSPSVPDSGTHPAPVETWRQRQHRLQMQENDGRLTLRPEAADRRRRIERLGFDERSFAE
jgi:hypothetical protein